MCVLCVLFVAYAVSTYAELEGLRFRFCIRVQEFRV